MSADIMKDTALIEEITYAKKDEIVSLVEKQMGEIPPRITRAITNEIRKMAQLDAEGTKNLSLDELSMKLSMAIPFMQKYLEDKRKKEAEDFAQQFSTPSVKESVEEKPAAVRENTVAAATPFTASVPDKKEVLSPVKETAETAEPATEVSANEKPAKKEKEKKDPDDLRSFFSVNLGSSKKVVDSSVRRKEITAELQRLRAEKEFTARTLSYRSEDMVIIDAIKDYYKGHKGGYAGYDLTNLKGILHFAVNCMLNYFIEQKHPALPSIQKAVLEERERQAALDKKICALEEERMSLR